MNDEAVCVDSDEIVGGAAAAGEVVSALEARRDEN